MIVLFDLNGTLTDASPIGSPELGDAVLERAVLWASVDALTGRSSRVRRSHPRGGGGRGGAARARAGVGRGSRRAGRRGLGPASVEEAVERAGALPARPGAEAALRLLSDSGFRLAVLKNSGAASGRRPLERVGLADRFEAILGADAVRSVKPHPSTYRHAVEALGAGAGSVTLAAAHDWDPTGAKRAGLRTAFVDHGHKGLSPAAETPDVHASDIEDLAMQLIRRST